MSGSPEPPPSPQLKRPERRSVPSEPTDWGYTSYSNFTTTRGTKYSSESYEDSYNNNSYSSKTKVGRRTEHLDFFLTFSSFLQHQQGPGVTGGDGVGLASLK